MSDWYEDFYRNRDSDLDYWRPQEPAPVITPPMVPVVKKSPKLFPRRTDMSTATATAIDNFEKTVKQHVAKKIGDPKAILEQITAIKTAVPPVYDEDKIKVFLTQRAKALNVLIDNYLVARLSSQYPMLDNEIFKLKRHLYIKDGTIIEDSVAAVKGNAIHCEALLFLVAPTDQKKRIEVAKYRSRKGDTWSGYENTTVTVTANVPAPPQEVAELGRKALGFYHSALSEIYNNPATSDLMLPEEAPALETLWIPTASSLSVKVDVERIPAPKHPDPALLLRHKNRYYLISMWDIKEELPFENILREFSVGPAEFPKKEKAEK